MIAHPQESLGSVARIFSEGATKFAYVCGTVGILGAVGLVAAGIAMPATVALAGIVTVIFLVGALTGPPKRHGQ